MSEMDLFDAIAGEPQEEHTPFEELPAGAWVLAKTATKDNGGAAPTVRADEDKRKTNPDGSPIIYRKFNVGLYTLGGDAKILDRHRNRSSFFNCFILPGDQELERNPNAAVGGRFAGFLNAVFASGVGADLKDAKARSAARWKRTMEVLKGTLAEHPECTLAQYDGVKGRLIAGTAVLALLEQSHTLLFKTKLHTFDSHGEKKSRVEPGDFEDSTEENISKRKVRLLEGVEEVVAQTTVAF